MRRGHRAVRSGRIRFPLCMAGAQSAFWAASAFPALAAEHGPAVFSRVLPVPIVWAAVVSVVLVSLGVGLVLLRWRAKSRGIRLVRRLKQLQGKLEEAESLLVAEPLLLYVWRGKGDAPYRLLGDLRGIAGLPDTTAQRLDFAGWLDNRSFALLDRAIARLRADGCSFNVILETKAGGFLEADGRAAGGMATLRLRTVEGDRLAYVQMTAGQRGLAEENARLQALLDALPLPLWRRGRDGALAWVNRAYAHAVNAKTPDVAVRAGIELAPGAARREQAPDGGATRYQTHCVIAGERRATEITETEMETGRAGMAIDISALEQARMDLDLHISAHDAMLRRLTTAVAVHDGKTRLKFFNRAYAELWNLDPAWLETGPTEGEILDRLRDARLLPEQADYRKWRSARLDAYTNGHTETEPWYLPDGRTVRVMSEHHPSGGLTHLFEDITEALDLESRYKVLDTVQKETIDRLHEAVALFGSDGRLRLYNPAYVKMWRLDGRDLNANPHINEVVGWCRPLYDEEAAWDDLKWAVTALDRERRNLDATLNRTDGSVLRFSAVPLPDGATLLTYVDVTDSTQVERALRERNDALEEAHRRKTEFVSHMNYQLRIPLTSIIGFAEYLDGGFAGDLAETQHRYVGDILKSSRALLSIINSILDLATIDADAMALKKQPVDLKAAMKDALAALAPEMKKKSMRAQIAAPRDLDPLVADEARVKQILHNLLSNAISFSDPGGEIKLTCRRVEGRVVLAVSDRGRGIAPDDQDRVFERFETRTRGSEPRGVGLGLAIVKSLMALHGGVVELHSTPGEGTTVECHFPAQRSEHSPPGARDRTKSDDKAA